MWWKLWPWRSPCSLHTCELRNADRRRCLHTRRTADSVPDRRPSTSSSLAPRCPAHLPAAARRTRWPSKTARRRLHRRPATTSSLPRWTARSTGPGRASTSTKTSATMTAQGRLIQRHQYTEGRSHRRADNGDRRRTTRRLRGLDCRPAAHGHCLRHWSTWNRKSAGGRRSSSKAGDDRQETGPSGKTWRRLRGPRRRRNSSVNDECHVT